MPEVRLNASDAAELAELQQFLSGWLARDLAASLADCAGNPGLGTTQLRQDLDRFIFLLGGGDDGGELLGRHRRNANGTVSPPRGQPSPKPPASTGLSVSSGNGVLRCAGGDTAKRRYRKQRLLGTGVPGAGRGQASYLLSASTRRSMSSSTLPDLGSCRPASWSLSSALVRPS